MSVPLQTVLGSLECTRMQLKGVIDEADRLLNGDFPYRDSRSALLEVLNVCRTQQRYLTRLSSRNDPKTIQSACASSADLIRQAHELLGFILRSTNTRNAFEAYGPLLRLAQQFLGSDAKLLLSSEWHYFPFLLLPTQHLSDEYVLIGQPATESSNPFVLPLAAHELGHSVWRRYDLELTVRLEVQAQVEKEMARCWPEISQAYLLTSSRNEITTDLAGARVVWMQIVDLCMAQLEELFCDALGVAIFGSSYLHAFSYILTPHRALARNPQYPSLLERAEFQITVAAEFGHAVPVGYDSIFATSGEAGALKERIMLQTNVADEARRKCTGHMLSRVREIIKTYYKQGTTREGVKSCLTAFHFLVPAQGAACMSDIINAAWEALLTEQPFCSKHLNDDKLSFLTELTLKSLELLEIDSCLQQGAMSGSTIQ